MTHPDVTFEAVERVSNALVAEGLKPTVRSVRERLGGSNTTLVRHLRAWNEARSVLDHQARDLPGELVLAMRRALSAAEQSGRSQLLQQLESAQQTADELVQECDALVGRLEVAHGEGAALRSERDELRGRLEAAVEVSERMGQELQNERLATAAARSELAKAAVRSDAAELVVSELRAREHAAVAERGQVQSRLDELGAKLTAQQTSAATLSAQLEFERRRGEELQRRLDEVSAATAACSSWVERAAAAEAAAGELRRTVATLESLLAPGVVEDVDTKPREAGGARRGRAEDKK